MIRMVDFRDWLAQTGHYLLALGLIEGLRFSWADIRGIRELREVQLGGQKIFLRTASSDFRVAEGILVRGEYRLVQAEHPMTILDVGANIGASAIYFAHAYPEATVYAFEPEAGNFEVLKKNCGPWRNIVPLPQAIWSRAMSREIQNRKTGAWGYTVAEVEGEASELGQRVECISIPDFMEQRGLAKIDILKIDIEGGEKEIFEHADGWIDRVAVLAVELHDRICPGCTEAFERAARGFDQKEAEGEKIVARRSPPT
jgi:FkbM family methyltransferase